jgi:hypothetical protein
MKIKIEFELDIKDTWLHPEDPEELEWFIEVLNDKENTNAMLWSNEIGDEIGSTNNFKYDIL